MNSDEIFSDTSRIPSWLRIKLPKGGGFNKTRRLIADLKLNTVCDGAKCPNSFECYSNCVATFLILGSQCTRNCAFCNIATGPPQPVQADEPARVSEAASRLGLSHVVITSVTRDDLPDGGAAHFAAVIERIRRDNPAMTTEVLVPDFKGSRASLENVLAAAPDVFNHNLETAPRLYKSVRPAADYKVSLTLLAAAKAAAPEMAVKTGLMVGLGEADEEIYEVLADVAATGCDAVTIGQYMRPSLAHHPVARWVPPGRFEDYAAHGRNLSISHMFCAPLVRSSYHAAELLAARDK